MLPTLYMDWFFRAYGDFACKVLILKGFYQSPIIFLQGLSGTAPGRRAREQNWRKILTTKSHGGDMHQIRQALHFAARINLSIYDMIDRAENSQTLTAFLAAILEGHKL